MTDRNASDQQPAHPPAVEPPADPGDLDREAERIIREYEEGRVTPRATRASEPKLSNEEFRKLLDEMAAMGVNDTVFLPPDWSRHDLYEDDD